MFPLHWNPGKLISQLRRINFASEDMIFKRHFSKIDKSSIHEAHLKSGTASCAFCIHLSRSYCHAHCLKCSLGTYIHCSPLLPGLMYYDKKNPDESDPLPIPWMYKKTCSNFNRLDRKNYLRNFKIPFSWVTIYNYEILEGLVYGFSAKEKPCHICATIDYSIYKQCIQEEDFEKSTPCTKISSLVDSIYQSKS